MPLMKAMLCLSRGIWGTGDGEDVNMLAYPVPKVQRVYQPFLLCIPGQMCVRFRRAAGGSWAGSQSAKCSPDKLSRERDHVSLPPSLLFFSSSLLSLPSFLLFGFSILLSAHHH